MTEQEFLEELEIQFNIKNQAQDRIAEIKTLYELSLTFNPGDLVTWCRDDWPDRLHGYILCRNVHINSLSDKYFHVTYEVTPPLKSGGRPKKLLPNSAYGTAESLNLKHSSLYEAPDYMDLAQKPGSNLPLTYELRSETTDSPILRRSMPREEMLQKSVVNVGRSLARRYWILSNPPYPGGPVK